MSLHIYSDRMQPATGFQDHTFDPPMSFGAKAGRLIWCECCRKRHRAANVVVQCYYDGWRYWCAPGKGCKAPKVIAAKRRLEFRNRSQGQTRRWARVARERLAQQGQGAAT